MRRREKIFPVRSPEPYQKGSLNLIERLGREEDMEREAVLGKRNQFLVLLLPAGRPPLILSQMGGCLCAGRYGGCLYDVTCFL